MAIRSSFDAAFGLPLGPSRLQPDHEEWGKLLTKRDNLRSYIGDADDQMRQAGFRWGTEAWEAEHARRGLTQLDSQIPALEEALGDLAEHILAQPIETFEDFAIQMDVKIEGDDEFQPHLDHEYEDSALFFAMTAICGLLPGFHFYTLDWRLVPPEKRGLLAA